MVATADVGEGGNRVPFRSWNPKTPRDMVEGARDNPIGVHGILFLPDGERPQRGWPAVVVAQGLGGPKPHREVAYGRWLAEQGYAALVLDSFGSRGIGGPDPWKALRLTTAMMLADAFGALLYMQNHPELDGQRIAIKGYSYGGMVTLLTAFEPIRRRYLPDGEKFAGHISYYGCSIPRMEKPVTTGAPVLIMIGKKDRNVSVSRMKEISENLRRGGSEVDLRVFDCYHQWDGNDVKPRRVNFNLRHCEILVDPDGILYDEKTGRKIESFFERLVFLARYVSLGGYTIQQDTNITQQSNEALLAFLERMGTGDAASAEAVAVGR